MNKVGFFREFRLGDDSLPSVLDGNRISEEWIAPVVNYLNQGVVFIAVPGIVRDNLREGRPPIGPGHYLTDGEWIWPYELGYLVENYKVGIPIEFSTFMISHNWIIDARSIDLMEVEERFLVNGE